MLLTECIGPGPSSPCPAFLSMVEAAADVAPKVCFFLTVSHLSLDLTDVFPLPPPRTVFLRARHGSPAHPRPEMFLPKTPRGKNLHGKAMLTWQARADHHTKSDSGVDHPPSTPLPEDLVDKNASSEPEVRVSVTSAAHNSDLTTHRAQAMTVSAMKNSCMMSFWSGSRPTTLVTRARDTKRVSIVLHSL